MKLVEQKFEIISLPENLLETIELCGRTCYKSEDKITKDSAAKFVRNLIKRKHHAMIEFGDIIVKLITNRGVTHEMVRHRLCSFAQESTRYVNYGGSDNINFIKPVWWNESTEATQSVFLASCRESESAYNILLDKGWRPEQAREVLPNALKTEIVVKANVREWRHIFSLRADKAAHPQMRALMIDLLSFVQMSIPIVFDDM